MLKQSFDVIKGYLIWSVIRWKERLNEKKVVLVLTGENVKVDDYALRYLDDVLERKSADQALIMVLDEDTEKKVFLYDYRYEIRTRIVSKKRIELIYKWHCLGKFYKNLIFTYVRTDQDNLLERFLNETGINEEDVVCLALYNLRKVSVKAAGIQNVRN